MYKMNTPENSQTSSASSAGAYAVASVASRSVSTLETSNFYSCPECLGSKCECSFITYCELCCPCAGALSTSRNKEFYELTEPIKGMVKICSNCNRPKSITALNGDVSICEFGCKCGSEYFTSLKGVNRVCRSCANMLSIADKLDTNKQLCLKCGDVSPCSCVVISECENGKGELTECYNCCEEKGCDAFKKYSFICNCLTRNMCDDCITKWLKIASTCPTCRFNNFVRVNRNSTLKCVSHNYFKIDYERFVCDGWNMLRTEAREAVRNPYLKNLFTLFIERNVKFYDEVVSKEENETCGVVVYKNIFKFLCNHYLNAHFPNYEMRELFYRFFITTDDGDIYTDNSINDIKLFDFTEINEDVDIFDLNFKIYVNVAFDRWEIFGFSFHNEEKIDELINDEISDNIHLHQPSDLIPFLSTRALRNAFNDESPFWFFAREEELRDEVQAMINWNDYANWLRDSFRFPYYLFNNAEHGIYENLRFDNDNDLLPYTEDFEDCYFCATYEDYVNLY